MAIRSLAACSLLAWREALGLNQSEAARRLGMDQSYLCKLERGSRKPGRTLALLIERITEGRVSVASWDQTGKVVHDAA